MMRQRLAPHAEALALDQELSPWLIELQQALARAIRGKDEVIRLVLAGLLARGHLLLEDLPGVGKTTLAKALAHSIGGRFARIQCTPDLLPTDITGFSWFNQKTREFEFQPGPVFADVLLVDELNRATPRTQSALLEAMAERQVTVDNQRYPLSSTFFVIATQNPLEHQGTYPLPEAQLDRFAMKLSIGYPAREDEINILAHAELYEGFQALPTEAVISREQLQQLQQLTASIAVHPSVRAYLVDLGRATRQHKQIRLGISPRGLLIWQRVAQAWALLHHRTFVTPDDIQAVAIPVLSVRLGVDAGKDVTPVIRDLLCQLPVPT
ncbi:MAG: MoxR family ATPase [Gemmatales bacterium]|nr:MoxR family ATPase [Gemmatales bacterium]